MKLYDAWCLKLVFPMRIPKNAVSETQKLSLPHCYSFFDADVHLAGVLESVLF